MFLNFDITELYSFITKEFDYSKNKEISINTLSLEYIQPLWWSCDRNHSWQATLKERIDGNNCPICSNRKLHRGKNDLQSTHPELAKEWDYENNDTLTPEDVTEGSLSRVHWVCSVCNNHWVTSVTARTGPRKNGCPSCARKKVWKKRYKEKLQETGCISNPKLLKDWDYEANYPLKPSDFTSSSNKRVWWKCHVCNYSFEDKINNRNKALYCPVCTNRIVVKGLNDLQTTHPDIAVQWHPTKNGNLKPTQFSYGNAKKVWWICPIGHEYQSTILNRTRKKGNGNCCPICDARRHTSFAEQAVFFYVRKYYPNTINRYKDSFLKDFELDIFIPDKKIAIEYDGKAWHKDSLFEREKRKYLLCKENGITLIRLKETKKKDSDLETCDFVFYTMWEHDILEKTICDLLQFLGINNYDIHIEKDKFQITKIMDKEYSNSFGKLYPELAKQWHFQKNFPATPYMFSCGTHFKAWWICPDCGNEYEAEIASRASGTGCRKCAMDRFWHNKNRKVARLNLKTNEIEKIYDSITEAANDCGLKSSSNITSVCKGKKKSVGGFGWKYINK